MSLKIYNTLGRVKEIFVPNDPHQVKMYCCGPTVYGLLHVGNFRGPVFYHLVREWLEHLGYQVNFVYNYTDVDDKILKRALEENRSPKAVAEEFINEFQRDFASLELRPHTANPRVTEHMDSIIAVIENLIASRHAYVVDGEVFYSVASFKDYGKLSGRKPDDMQSGSRIDVDQKKQSPLDFSLWKPAKESEQGEDQSWSSPWGMGRPGWHIECTAMIHKLLGPNIDIHGGGLDLAFPHHENEIAQGEAACPGVYAKYWLHNNMFNFSGAKMSKSSGNVRTMRAFLEEYNGEIFKFLVMSVHYRSEAEFSEETTHTALKSLAKFYSSLTLAELSTSNASPSHSLKITAPESPSSGAQLHPQVASFQSVVTSALKDIEAALNDDFNTPQVFAALYELMRQFQGLVRVGIKVTPQLMQIAQIYVGFVRKVGKWMGLFQKSPPEYLRALDDLLLKKLSLGRNVVDDLVSKRWQAKTNKDFATADALRAELTTLGIAVQDTATGSTWEVAK